MEVGHLHLPARQQMAQPAQAPKAEQHPWQWQHAAPRIRDDLASQPPFPGSEVPQLSEAAEPEAAAIASLVHALGGTGSATTVSAAQRSAARDLAHRLSASTASCATAASAGAIQPLVRLLTSADAEVQRHAACALRVLARADAAHGASIADAGAIPSLVRLLRSSDAGVQCEAADALCALARAKPANRASIASDGAIQPLVHLLDSADTLVQRAAADTLAILACRHDTSQASVTHVDAASSLAAQLHLVIGVANQESIASAGATPVLVSRLRSADAEVQRAAADALCNLAFGNAANAASIASVDGAIPLLVHLLRSADVQVQRAAADALTALARGDDASRNSITAAGAISLLVGLLNNEDLKAQGAAASALSSLACGELADKASIASAGAIPRLVHLLGSADAEVQRWAARALANLAHDSTDNKASVVHAGAVPQLARLLDSADTNVQCASAAALCNLVFLDEYKASIGGNAGMLKQLVRLLASPDSEVQATAACVLANLASGDDETTARVARAGAIVPLVQLLGSADPDTQLHAVAALRNLARAPEGYHGPITEAGAIPLLVRLLGSGNVEVQCHAADALIFIGSASASNRIRIASEGAIPQLVLMLRGPRAEAHSPAAAVLSNLAAEVATHASIVSTNAIPLLLGLLDSTDELTQHAAAFAMGNLAAAGSPATRASMQRAGAVPTLLRVLGRGDVPERVAKALSRCMFALTQPEAVRAPVAASSQPREPAQPVLRPQMPLMAALNTWPDRLEFQMICEVVKAALQLQEHTQRAGWIEPGELVFRRSLGEGAFGVVLQSDWAGRGPVAVKWVGMHQGSGFTPEVQTGSRMVPVGPAKAVVKEVYHHAKLHHPHIVQLYGITADEAAHRLGIVMEYVEGAAVSEVAAREGFNAEQRFRVATEMAHALEHLHLQTPPIVHRDLSGSNILVSAGGRAKLIDFGISQERRQTYLSRNGHEGTVAWAAPEVLVGSLRIRGAEVLSDVTTACDVYSFGVLLGLLATRKEPWEGLCSLGIVQAIMAGMRLAAPTGIHDDLRDLIASCLQPNASVRPSFDIVRLRLAAMGPGAFVATGTWPTLGLEDL